MGIRDLIPAWSVVRQPRSRYRFALGGATLDNEENYLIKKFFTAMEAVQIENQVRV